MQLLPHNREMVNKYKKKPFALVGVNSDGSRSALQKIVKDQKLNYRSAVGGTTDGPIAKQYSIEGWPTVFVLDKKGVIRYKFVGVDPDTLTKAVDSLLKTGK